MKKGDIIWIRYKDCIYCSEVDSVRFMHFGNASSPPQIQIKLIPIIGNCVTIYAQFEVDLNFIKQKHANVIGQFARPNNYIPYDNIEIALDVHDLFYGEGENNLDTVQ